MILFYWSGVKWNYCIRRKIVLPLSKSFIFRECIHSCLPQILQIPKHFYFSWKYILLLQIFVYKPAIIVYLINNSTHNKILRYMKRISISVWSDLNRQEYSITCPVRVQTPKRVSCTQLMLSKISTVFPKARKLDRMWNIRDDSFFIYSYVCVNLWRFLRTRWRVYFIFQAAER